MVEGDLLDLSLPNLMTAMSADGSTVMLRVQRGDEHGAVYFHEGVLVHAHTEAHAGNDAVYELLSWVDGRFRLVRDPERRPRTVTHRAAEFLTRADHQPDPFGTSPHTALAPAAGSP